MAKSKYPPKPLRPRKSDSKDKWVQYEKDFKSWETACCNINKDEADKLKIVERSAEAAKKKPTDCKRSAGGTKRKRR